MPAPWCRVVVAVALLPAAATAQAGAPVSRGVVEVFSGQFITLDPSAPRAQAIATRNGRIIAVGTQAHVDSVAGRGARHARLSGYALPGFADAHVHAAMLGDVLQSVDLRGASRDTVLARVLRAAQRAAPGAWILGGGWDQSFWSPPEYPTATDLDAASAGHPVLFERIDGHAVWVNSRAMQLAGLTRATKDPPGGRVVRDASGTPSGIFIDLAIALVRRAVPPLSMAQRVHQLRLAMAQYARWGLTSIHDAGVELADIESYRRLLRDGPLPVRVYAMASSDEATLSDVLARGPEIGGGQGTFTLRCVKIVDDGALGSRGARLSTPYSDEAVATGFKLVPDARLDTIIARSLARGFQVAIHAIGDASNHDVLNAFARAGARGKATRFRLEHASMIRDEDVPRLVSLGVIASMQPVFVGEYSRFAETRLGAARLPWVYRTRDVLESGTVLASGTDFPASDTGDPIATLFSLVTRRGYDGLPSNGWLPGQRISIDAALRSMTIGAAYAAFEEDQNGILRVGMRADLTVLSADPYSLAPDQLRSLRVMRTIVAGHTTFAR